MDQGAREAQADSRERAVIGALFSLTVQLIVIAIQLTVWLVRILVILMVTLAQGIARGLESSSRRRGRAQPLLRLGARPRRLPLPADLRWTVFGRDGYACVVCGSNLDLTVDHIHPVSLGGTNDPSNLQTLCRSCNCSKGARVLV